MPFQEGKENREKDHGSRTLSHKEKQEKGILLFLTRFSEALGRGKRRGPRKNRKKKDKEREDRLPRPQNRNSSFVYKKERTSKEGEMKLG